MPIRVLPTRGRALSEPFTVGGPPVQQPAFRPPTRTSGRTPPLLWALPDNIMLMPSLELAETPRLGPVDRPVSCPAPAQSTAQPQPQKILNFEPHRFSTQPQVRLSGFFAGSG